MEFLLSLLIRLCQGAQGKYENFNVPRGNYLSFRYWFSLAKIPHFVRDDKFFKCHSERSGESFLMPRYYAILTEPLPLLG